MGDHRQKVLIAKIVRSEVEKVRNETEQLLRTIQIESEERLRKNPDGVTVQDHHVSSGPTLAYTRTQQQQKKQNKKQCFKKIQSAKNEF